MPRPAFLRRWEYMRHHQVHPLIECCAEAMGVFFYVWTGVGANVSLILTTLGMQPGLGSLFQVGAGYGIGIVLALTVNVATSGGHINPCITIAFAIFRGFPWRKVPQYIISQILGAYLACLVIYLQYKDVIVQLEDGLREAGKFDTVMFTPNGIAGAFALYANPGKPLGLIFWNEFVTDFLLAIVIWACLDPSNIVITPSVGTFVIAFGYAAAIWGFAVPGVSLNASRDVGARLAAMAIWGRSAAGDNYSAISALVNIPATLLGALIYETFLHDSDRVVSMASLEFIRAHTHNRRFHQATEAHGAHGHEALAHTNSNEKPSITTFENAPSRV